jgi:hypothetical protein
MLFSLLSKSYAYTIGGTRREEKVKWKEWLFWRWGRNRGNYPELQNKKNKKKTQKIKLEYQKYLEKKTERWKKKRGTAWVERERE